jgi:hypothetical protein
MTHYRFRSCANKEHWLCLSGTGSSAGLHALPEPDANGQVDLWRWHLTERHITDKKRRERSRPFGKVNPVTGVFISNEGVPRSAAETWLDPTQPIVSGDTDDEDEEGEEGDDDD